MSWNAYLREAVATTIDCRVFSAFNANVDMVISVRPEDVAAICRDHPELLAGDHSRLPGRPVSTPGHFLALLEECLAAGKSYYDIVQAELGEWFLQYFPEHTEAMGGQAGIIANQMAALGGDAYVYNPVLSKLQAEMYDSRVKFPVTIEGALNWVPIRDGVNSDWTKINYIFEYPKDTSYVFGDRVVTTVRANRIILGTRNPLAAMGFSEEMEAFLPEVGAAVDCGFMAGYHHGRIEGRAETLEEFIQLSLRQLTALRSGNRNLRLHCEYLPMSNPEQESVLLKALIPRFHSFGINEAEIMRALDCLGFAEEAGEIARDERSFSLYQGALRLFREFGLPRLHLHNLGYYIVLIRKPYPVSPEKVRQACLFASAVNGVKAKQGGAVPWEAVGQMANVPLSEVGMSQLEAFAEEARQVGYPITSEFTSTGIMEREDHICILTPAHIVPNPVSTVGMGDTISSSAFAAEVSLGIGGPR
jgi:ADP-dependent phosphofructokinase/glucokinase